MYALGVMLHQLFTGVSPLTVRGKDLASVKEEKVNEAHTHTHIRAHARGYQDPRLVCTACVLAYLCVSEHVCVCVCVFVPAAA